MELENSRVEAEIDALTPAARIQPSAKASPFSNDVLKLHVATHLIHHHPVVVTYKECLKNHAASLGGHALDGCGEFMPSPVSKFNPADIASLKCAACGCHRNFHRRVHEEAAPQPPSAAPTVEYQPQHRYQPPPSRATSGSSPKDSPSPPPISSSYPPAAPRMLFVHNHCLSGLPPDSAAQISTPTRLNAASTSILKLGSRKRFRTKFTRYQKERMLETSAKVGWKMPRRHDDAISDLCNEIGIDRRVFKVWMHNNKNTLGKKHSPPAAAAFRNGNGEKRHHDLNGFDVKPIARAYHLHGNTTVRALGTHGSSSSS